MGRLSAYGKIDDELFRKSVLVLLLFSGPSLIASVTSCAQRRPDGFRGAGTRPRRR
jgi:hypothetical protein